MVTASSPLMSIVSGCAYLRGPQIGVGLHRAARDAHAGLGGQTSRPDLQQRVSGRLPRAIDGNSKLRHRGSHDQKTSGGSADRSSRRGDRGVSSEPLSATARAWERPSESDTKRPVPQCNARRMISIADTPHWAVDAPLAAPQSRAACQRPGASTATVRSLPRPGLFLCCACKRNPRNRRSSRAGKPPSRVRSAEMGAQTETAGMGSDQKEGSICRSACSM